MIGRSLRERYEERAPLTPERAIAVLKERLPIDSAALVQVRAQGASMIACLIVRADDVAVRFCREIGLEMKPGGTGIVGLACEDAVRVFAQLGDAQRAWLGTPCGPRETKVVLVARGVELLSVEAEGGKVEIRVGAGGR